MADEVILDFQTQGMVVQAEQAHEIKTVEFSSTNQVVGYQGAFLEVTFVTLDDLLETDWLQVDIPKWNRQARFPFPMITYDPDELTCTGLINAKAQVNCFLQRGPLIDIVKLFQPLEKDLTPNEDGIEVLDDGIIPRGSVISVRVGPITNPISQAPVPGFAI